MKLKNLFKKYACNATTCALNVVANGLVNQGCYFIFYQPKTPEGLKDFSRDR